MRVFTLILLTLISFNIFSQDTNQDEVNLKTNFNLPGYLKLNFGFSFIENKDHSLKTDVFPSRSLDLYYSKPFFLGDNFSFNPGIGISNDKLSFSNDVILSESVDPDGNNVIIVDTLSFAPDKNSLKATYLVIPIDLKYYFGSGQFDKRRFFIGVGAEVGLLLNSSTKVKQTINNTIYSTKLKKDFGLNDLKYGISLQLGVGNFNIYYKKYLSNLFKDEYIPLHESINPSVNKIGISFSIF
tara:strand:- start:254 stop:976 length:723 start_codon:yes stop_codon:yes gene_type:complete